MKLSVLLLTVVTVAGCGPKDVKPSGVESRTGCPEACAHMRDNFPECPEGNDPDCVPGCQQIYNLGYVWDDDSSGPMCIVQANNKQELRDCNVECKEK